MTGMPRIDPSHKLRLLALSLLIALALVPPARAGAVLDRVKARGVLTGAVSDGFPPVGFLDPKTGDLAGFDVDVTRAIAGALGVKAVLVTPSWEVTVSGHWADRFDIAVGSMTPSIDRAAVLDFPAVYYRMPVAIAVHRDAKGINRMADLAGRRVGACSACSTERWLAGTLAFVGEPPPPGPGVKTVIALYEGEGTAFDDLRLGPGTRLDAVITNRPTIEAAIDKGYPFRILSPDAFAEPLAVAVDKGDPAFSQAVAEAVGRLRADGTLGALSRKWFGADLTGAAR